MDALQTHKVEKLPVIDKDGKLIGLVTYKDITKLRDYPNANKDAKRTALVQQSITENGLSVV